jgi:bifunctional non-homologous end joining protein LigD
VPQWTVDTGTGPVRRPPDRLVLDLDPGEGATIVDCCRVAERLQILLVADGLTPYPKTSGSKGMQLMAAIRTDDAGHPSAYAKALAQRLARETPDLVVAKMTKATLVGKVFIDWSQNHPKKTTIAPHSLRGRDHPTVSTPLKWGNLSILGDPEAKHTPPFSCGLSVAVTRTDFTEAGWSSGKLNWCVS